jgi:hypothetical protein
MEVDDNDGKPLFYVCAKLLSGEFLEVDLSPTAGLPGCLGAMTTVSTLKERIGALTGIQPDTMKLVFAGTMLEDHYLLSHYNVARGLSMHVMVIQRSTPFFPLAPKPDPSWGTKHEAQLLPAKRLTIPSATRS